MTKPPITHAFSRLPAPVRGAAWMLGASFSFALLTALVRHSSATIHPFEVVFFRNLFSLLFLLAFVGTGSLRQMRTRRFGMHVIRAATGFLAMTCWFTSISLMPIAEATALAFTAPLFATLGAALILREVVRVRRWTAILIGFLGAMIVIRPGIEAVNPVALMAIAGAAFMAGSMLTVKSLSRTESPDTIVIYLNLLGLPMAGLLAAFVWKTPNLAELLWLGALGGVATLGHICMARSLAVADLTAVLPFDFFRLIFVAVLGVYFFDETPLVWTWIGAAVIFGASFYTALRESRLRKTKGAPPPDIPVP